MLGLRFCARLSLVAVSGGHSSSRCAGLSLSRPLLLRSTGSRCAGSVVVAHGPSCSAACGIFPDQGSNPCPLHWQVDSYPLRHQGSPNRTFKEMLWGRCRTWPRSNLKRGAGGVEAVMWSDSGCVLKLESTTCPDGANDLTLGTELWRSHRQC